MAKCEEVKGSRLFNSSSLTNKACLTITHTNKKISRAFVKAHGGGGGGGGRGGGGGFKLYRMQHLVLALERHVEAKRSVQRGELIHLTIRIIPISLGEELPLKG